MASSGYGRLNGPYSPPRNPAVMPPADVDERRDRRVPRPENLRHPGADVGSGHGPRRDIPRVPVVLMPGVEDVPEVGHDVRADQGAAVEHLRDALQALRDLDVGDGRVDARERAEDPVRRRADLVRGESLGVERLGGGHAAGHPQDDDRVGRWDRVLDGPGGGAGAVCQDGAGFAPGQGRQGGRAGGLEEPSASPGPSGLHRVGSVSGSTGIRGA